MAPDESVILPFANVKFPIVEPVAAEQWMKRFQFLVTLKLPDANVPVVLKFSLSNEMAPDESVILPLLMLNFL